MNTTTITETDRILAGMLVENTGSHFLDSGGAYGRAWQRNQAEVGDDDPVLHFLARPDAWADRWGCVTVDLFHFLRQRLDYSPTFDHAWRLWCYLDDSDRWSDSRKYLNSFGTLELFVEQLAERGWVDKRAEFFGGGLTYNHDNVMSQDFHWFAFMTTDDCPWTDWPTLMVAINIHGGCDARGGYTDFRMFEVGGYDGYCSLMDFDSAEMWYQCDGANDPDPAQITLDGGETRKPCPYTANKGGQTVAANIRGGYVEWYWSGDYSSTEPEKLDDDNNGQPTYRCTCGGTLTLAGVSAPHPY